MPTRTVQSASKTEAADGYGGIPQGEDPMHSWQVDHTEPLSVDPVGLQMGFDRIDIDSLPNYAYLVVDAKSPSTIKESE